MIPKEERCKEQVHDGSGLVSFHQCTRRTWKDGYCKQHHPDNKETRRKKSEAKINIKIKINDLRWALQGLHKDCVDLVKRHGSLNSYVDNVEFIQLAGKIKNLELPTI